MAVFIGNAVNNIANAPGGVLVGFVGGNLAQLQDALGDTIVGLGGNDFIVAGNGNDVINGGDGNDFIDGRFGFDVMDGGNGIDTMDVSFFAGAYIWDMATGITNFSGWRRVRLQLRERQDRRRRRPDHRQCRQQQYLARRGQRLRLRRGRQRRCVRRPRQRPVARRQRQ